MKKLYFVRLYNSRSNEYLRVLTTVHATEDDKVAERMALDSVSHDWRAASSSFVCNTPDNVFQHY